MSAFFQWIEHSWLGTSVNNSLWAFAAFEAVHLLALAVIGGAVWWLICGRWAGCFPVSGWPKWPAKRDRG